MPKLDSQGRLLIPLELREELGWTVPKEIAICYNFQDGNITIISKSDIADKNVISFRKLDPKGRFCVPNEVFNLLKLGKTALFIPFLHNNILCIKGIVK